MTRLLLDISKTLWIVLMETENISSQPLFETTLTFPNFILSSTISRLLKTLGRLTTTTQKCLNTFILILQNMDGWRASNQRDEFPQMIRWLSRQEKITTFEIYQKNLIKQLDSELASKGSTVKSRLSVISIPKYPNYLRHRLSLIEERHQAPDFTYYLKVFLMTKDMNRHSLDNNDLPFGHVDVYNMFHQ